MRDTIRKAKDQPCADCGLRYPYYLMDFDHRDRRKKRFNIGRDALSKVSTVDALRVEVEKCDVVCANCHRVRTYRRRTKLGRQDSNLD
jgi:hypothetical protein